jgi:hypothetical protein
LEEVEEEFKLVKEHKRYEVDEIVLLIVNCIAD